MTRIKRFSWVLALILLPLSLYCLLCLAQTDEYGRYSRVLGNLLVFFLRYGIVSTAALIALGYAKDFKDLLVNLALVSVPMVIVSYPYGWLVLYINPVGWSNFFGHTGFGLMFCPLMYAVPALVATPLICIAAGLIIKKAHYRYLNLYARRTLIWGLCLFMLAVTIISFI